MKIVIIGTGYVGLVTGACLAEMGHTVTCLDIDAKKIESLESGIIPIYEPGLEEVVKRNKEASRLFFTTSYKEAFKDCLVAFLALPTPAKEDGSCDLSYVLKAAKEIGEQIKQYCVIVSKSTVPVGSCEKIRLAILSSQKEKIPFDIVSNPEFLKEGSAVTDCMKPDRIVLGVDSAESAQIMRDLYSAFTINHDRILVMDIPSAEMTKYAANAMLATRISFMNEMAGLCERLGADINQVRIGIGSDHRIGYHFLYAGMGYGGSCFPKDLKALASLAKEVGYKTPLLEAVETINENQKQILAKKINTYFSPSGGINGKTIALWGLSFKPDTDDIREAPSLQLIQELLSQGASLRLYDPICMNKIASLFPSSQRLHFCKDEYEAAEGADAIALVTEWKQFRFVDLEEILKKMVGKAFFDGRNQYKRSEMHTKGFHYYGIGLPSTH